MRDQESLIELKIPGIQSLLSKATEELKTEINCLGKSTSADAVGRLMHFINLHVMMSFF